MSNRETVVRKFYEALNRFDVPTILEMFTPDCRRVEWEGTPSEGKFSGLKELEAHINQGRSTWSEGSCDPEHFTHVGNIVIVDVHVLVRQKDKTEWIDGRVGDVFVLTNDKISEFRSFMKMDEAREWAIKVQKN